MEKNWIDIEDDDEAFERGHFRIDYDQLLGDGVTSPTPSETTEEPGEQEEFWYSRVRRHRDQPAMRYAIAMDGLPYPAAFEEAALGLRALIRQRRKGGEPYDEELELLYEVAALESFMLDYSERLREPGFNVMNVVPGKRLREVDYSWTTLGHERLRTLKKTDVKWMVEAWGEPEQHTTLNDMHREMWDRYEDRLIEEKERERRKSKESLDDLVRRGGRGRSWWRRIFEKIFGS